MTDLLKYCPECKIYKPATPEYFHRNKSMSDGFQRYCKECRKEQDKRNADKNRARKAKYREEHKEEIAQKLHIYYENHREVLLERAADYRKNNPDRMKNYRELNKDRIREYRKDYYRDNAEQIRNYFKNNREKRRAWAAEWRDKNPDKTRQQKIRRRTIENNLPYDFSEENEKFAFEYFNYKCAVCGKELDLTRKHSWAMDHWIAITDPRPNNPGTVPTNMLPLCHGIGGCNNSKFNNDPIEWLHSKFPEQADDILVRIETYFNLVGVKEDGHTFVV